MIHLSPRLQALFGHLAEGEPLWDLCCDHGLLGQRALETGRFASVHFVDRVPEIVAALEERVRGGAAVPATTTFHALDAQDLPHTLRGSVVIAGVGGTTILEILSGLEARGALQASRLVLSSQTRAQSFPADFARVLGPAGWRIVTSELVREGPRERPVWVAERAREALPGGT
jgi:tRNA (adenine22-N1)-methyltransferase